MEDEKDEAPAVAGELAEEVATDEDAE